MANRKNRGPSQQSPQNAEKDKKAPSEHKDMVREAVETVVFVAVLVLMMQSFVAEAFVIPTGSMAVTLLGDHTWVTCGSCGYVYPINTHSEIEPERRPDQDGPNVSCTCPNCRYSQIVDVDTSAGDRLLVGKSAYDLYPGHPSRFDVVVFKYPREPIQNTQRLTYIKRLVGLPGEAIAIYQGDLYVSTTHQPSESEIDNSPDAWKHPLTKEIDPKELKGFEILRKPPEQILAMRRIVNDNDLQDEKDRSVPRRWLPATKNSWKAADSEEHPRIFECDDERSQAAATDLQWLRYNHILRPPDPHVRQLITDFLGYNSTSADPDRFAENWVGDLILEGDLMVKESKGAFVMELSRGIDRFRVSWDLSGKTCTLQRITDSKTTIALDTKEIELKPQKTYHLRFANVDRRLTLWVNGKLAFGDGVEYNAVPGTGPAENDFEPASFGVSGANVRLSGIKLYRDTYYTLYPGGSDSPDLSKRRAYQRDLDKRTQELVDKGHTEKEARIQATREIEPPSSAENPRFLEVADGKQNWRPLRDCPACTIYVQPNCYLCLGDNSPGSSDGRVWGLVPERLLLGKAAVVYWPPSRIGRIK